MLSDVHAECHLCSVMFMLCVMLNVIYTECRYADCHGATNVCQLSDSN